MIVAQGYQTGEVFLDPIGAPRDIDDLVVELVATGSERDDATRAHVTGRVSNHGERVTDGWVGLWYPRRESDILNVALRRGCPVPTGAQPFQMAELGTDGTFELASAHPGRPYLVVRVPGLPDQIQRLKLQPGSRQSIDVDVQPGGGIHGRVVGFPERMAGRLWVVAFDADIERRDVRIDRDGRFAIEDLPPGEYGLRVGHPAFSLRRNAYPAVFGRFPIGHTARPWAGIDRIRVRSGETVDDVELSFER